MKRKVVLVALTFHVLLFTFVMSRRPERVGEQIHRAISKLLLYEVRDPRLANLTVTRVEVTGDLRRATVYVSSQATEEETAELLRGLESANSFLRRALAQRLQLRYAPELRFDFDERVVEHERLQNLLDELHTDRNS